MTTSIRDLREAKLLSQDKVAAAAGVTYSVFVRIEDNIGKTTPAEVQHVFSVLQGMDSGTRRLAGRPFKNPDVRARVAAARAAGESVSAILSRSTPEPASEPEPEPEDLLLGAGPETVAQRKARMARERRAAKKLL